MLHVSRYCAWMNRKKYITWQEDQSRRQIAKIELLSVLSKRPFLRSMIAVRCTKSRFVLSLSPWTTFSFDAFNFEVPFKTRLSHATRDESTPFNILWLKYISKYIDTVSLCALRLIVIYNDSRDVCIRRFVCCNEFAFILQLSRQTYDYISLRTIYHSDIRKLNWLKASQRNDCCMVCSS